LLELSQYHWNFSTDFYTMVDDARSQFANGFFMEVFIIAAWLIWKQINNLIFNRNMPTFQLWCSSFFEEARLQAHRMG
jgi:hypothetical protein